MDIAKKCYEQDLRLCTSVHLEHQFLDIPITLGQKPGLYIESDKVSAVYSDRKITALEVSNNFLFVNTNVNFLGCYYIYFF